jgi:hypothetical protein
MVLKSPMMHQCDTFAIQNPKEAPMCINNYRNLMRIEDDMNSGHPPGLMERVFYWVLAKLRR